MDAGLLYQNARVKAKETLLLGADRLQRIADAATLEEAVRLLAEAGYPSGNSTDEILAAAEREAALLFKQCMAEGYGLELFLAANDFHNAKVAAKAHYFGGSKEGYKIEGNVAVTLLEESLEKAEYSSLPREIAAVYVALDKEKAKETLLPSAVDVLTDKAAFAAFAAGKKSAAKVIADYFSLLADLKNVSVAYRAYQAGISREKAKSMLLPGGAITEKDLLKIVDQGEDAAEKISAEKAVDEAIAALKEGLFAYEVYSDNALLRVFKKARYDMFSPAPIVGLYLGKLREITNVRLLLARLANGVDKDVIKGRMRELYV